MSKEILIIGQSGTGKSTSMRNLDPASTAIINVTGKGLPFPKSRTLYTEVSKENPSGNLFNVDTCDKVIKALNYINTERPDIKVIIIDDAGYLMSFEYIKRAKETGFHKFTDIGTGFSNVITKGKDLRDDLFFIVMMHSDTDIDAAGNKQTKAKSIGKLVDNYLNIEGMFNTVLYTNVAKGEDGKLQYEFITQNNGSNTGKSPMGLFNSLSIPNDLKAIIEKINEYYI